MNEEVLLKFIRLSTNKATTIYLTHEKIHKSMPILFLSYYYYYFEINFLSSQIKKNIS